MRVGSCHTGAGCHDPVINWHPSNRRSPADDPGPCAEARSTGKIRATDTRMPITPTDHALAGRLRKVLAGEVLFDRFSRGRYATDASHYQIEPVGVVIPKTQEDVVAAMAIAREEGVPVLPRGGGTSQSGQTVGRALVLDFSKYLNRLVAVDQSAASCVVEPGIVLDELNRQLKSTGLWFPVDVSTASRATIGGMAGNNSCGTRSIRYGIMR